MTHDTRSDPRREKPGMWNAPAPSIHNSPGIPPEKAPKSRKPAAMLKTFPQKPPRSDPDPCRSDPNPCGPDPNPCGRQAAAAAPEGMQAPAGPLWISIDILMRGDRYGPGPPKQEGEPMKRLKYLIAALGE